MSSRPGTASPNDAAKLSIALPPMSFGGRADSNMEDRPGIGATAPCVLPKADESFHQLAVMIYKIGCFQKAEQDDLRRMIESMGKGIYSVAMCLKSKGAAAATQQLDTLIAENESMLERILEKDGTIKKLTSELDDVRKELMAALLVSQQQIEAQKTAAEDNARELTSGLDALRERMVSMEEHNYSLFMSLGEAATRHEESKQINLMKEKHIMALMDENKELKSAVDARQKEIEMVLATSQQHDRENETCIKELTRERNELTVELDTSHGNAKGLTAELKELRQKLDCMVKERDLVRQELNCMVTEKEANVEEEKRRKELENSLKTKVQLQNNLLNTLTDGLAFSHQQIGTLKDELAAQKKVANEPMVLPTQKEVLEKKSICTLLQRIVVVANEIGKTQRSATPPADSSSEKVELNQPNHSPYLYTKEHDEDILLQEYEASIKKLLDELDSLRQKSWTALQEKEEKEESFNRLTAERDDLHRMIESMNKNNYTVAMSHQKEFDVSNKQTGTLKQTFDASLKEIDTLSKEKESLKKGILEKDGTIKKLTSELDAAARKVHALSKENEDLIVLREEADSSFLGLYFMAKESFRFKCNIGVEQTSNEQRLDPPNRASKRYGASSQTSLDTQGEPTMSEEFESIMQGELEEMKRKLEVCLKERDESRQAQQDALKSHVDFDTQLSSGPVQEAKKKILLRNQREQSDMPYEEWFRLKRTSASNRNKRQSYPMSIQPTIQAYPLGIPAGNFPRTHFLH